MKRTQFFKLVALAALAALTLPGTVAAQSQAYPNRPIRIVVPYAAGGPVDVVARVIGERLETFFQQRVLVDNRAGGNAAIGTEFVARSTPDGYTLLMGAPAHTANPSLMKLNFDTAKDINSYSSHPLQRGRPCCSSAFSWRDASLFRDAN